MFSIILFYLHGPMIKPMAWNADIFAIADVLSFNVVAPET